MATEESVERYNREGSDALPADCHPEIRTVVDYWRTIHPDIGLPGRQHFDPLDIPRLLPNIRMIDVVGAPPRFMTRLMGTKLREIIGTEHTGKYLDEVFNGFGRSASAFGLNSVVRTGRLNWRRGNPALFGGREFMTIERVYLPFARDGRTVDMILTYNLFGDSDGNMY